MTRRLFRSRFASRLVARDLPAAIWAAAAGVLLVALIGAALAAALNIWTDEAFTLYTTGAGPRTAWLRAITFEAQPPCYFVIEAAWRTLNEASIPFARLPSVFFAAAAVGAIVGAAHRMVPRVPPVLVAFVTAFNPLFVWAASELRVYALLLLIGAMLIWSFYEAFLCATPSRRAQVVYTFFALAGLYTQYYVGFVLVAHFLTLIVVRRDRLRAFVLSMAVTAVGFAPFVRIALMHITASGEFVSRATFLSAIHEIANVVFVFIFPHDLEWTGIAKIGGFIVAVLCAFALVAFGRPSLRDVPTLGIVAGWISSLVLFAFLFGVSGVPTDPPRHLIVLAAPTLLVGLLCTSAVMRWRRYLLPAMLIVFTMFCVGTFWSQYRPPLAKRGEWRRVAALLSSSNSHIPIAVFPAELALPLAAYLPSDVIAVPRPMPFRIDYVRATTLTSEMQVAGVLDPVHERSKQLWVITNGNCGDLKQQYNYNCSFLETYLSRQYRMVRSVVFRGSMVRLYERTGNVSADLPVRENVN